ncbi:MAG TPA: L-aspartate oxidase [Candidatus Polarisedimenticolia bacterium]|jgi:L-aspartate oxidase
MMKTAEVASAPERYDVIVVGSGVAGLRAAIEAAEGGLGVALLAKDSATDSSTDLAQGGVAVALSDEDQVGLHYSDTLAAGDGLCDEAAVSALVGEGPHYITQLIEWGARFDREGTKLAFTREAAHSANRILHAHGDSTGREILRALWRKAATLETVTFLPHTFSVDLILGEGACLGLQVLDERSGLMRPIEAGCVVLATGGAGQIFRETTNPPQATGDGIAIAWRAGARLRDMEFMQFHPTSLHLTGAPRFLLSEALRGEGGLLRGLDGRLFMREADPRGELAPRDVVARGIFMEMGRTGSDHVLLDLTHLDGGFLQRRFPRIHATCLKHGIDMTRDRVPVAPAAHYLMGGVVTDLRGRSTLPGLFAAGEVACSGVHGANRLASNSLLEGLVFGARAGQTAMEESALGRRLAVPPGPVAPPLAGARSCGPRRALEIAGMVKNTAWTNLGIVREAAGIESAMEALGSLLDSMEPAAAPSRAGLEACNMATVAWLVARCALARRESRGAHFRSDYPVHDHERFGRSSIIEITPPGPRIPCEC